MKTKTDIIKNFWANGENGKFMLCMRFKHVPNSVN